MNLNFAKLAFGMGLLGAVAMAHAQLFIISTGTWSGVDGNGNWTQTESVVDQSTAGLPSLNTFSLQTANDGTTAVGVYSDGKGDSLTLDFTLGSQVLNGAFYSVPLAWTYASGTGGYAGLTGEGTAAVSQFNVANEFSSTDLVGSLQAVPEPSTYAVLGLGLVGLLIRRSRG